MYLGLHGGAVWIDLERAGAESALTHLRVSDRAIATIRDWFVRFDCQIPNVWIQVNFSDGTAIVTRDPREVSKVSLRVELFDRNLYY